MSTGQPPAAATPQEFWDGLYDRVAGAPWQARVNPVLADEAGDLPPGAALDVGCGQGGDALWLARRGWQVTAVDISGAAVQRVTDQARKEGLHERVRPERHDLAESLPTGSWDLISAQYLHTTFELPKARILHELAGRLHPGGTLLLVDHASVAPWSWNQDATHPSPEETLDELELDPSKWETVACEARRRTATGPQGQIAEVTDNVIRVRRTD